MSNEGKRDATSGSEVRKRLLTEGDVATITSVSAATLRSWRARGRGPKFIRLGARTPRYRVEDLEAWLVANERTGGPR